MKQGRSLRTLSSVELFPVAYAIMLRFHVREEEYVKAEDGVRDYLDGKDKERETGMPSLPSWAVAADSFMPRGRAS